MKGHTCKVTGCSNILKVQDGTVCASHRLRKFRYGTYFGGSDAPTVVNKHKPCLTTYGYYRINVNGKRVMEHRHVMELHIGRKLEPKERVHHKNHVRTDNRIENLELITDQSNHIKMHHKKKPIIDWSLYSVPENNKADVCMVKGCTREPRSRCLCSAHFQSFYHNKH